MSHFPCTLLALLLALLISPRTAGAASTYISGGYTIRLWQTEDGLPQNLVTSAVQTHDGYVWLGTSLGLARFDGERFLVLNSANTPELIDYRIERLFEDSKGVLWMGHQGGALSCYQDGRIRSFIPPPAGEIQPIFGLGSDPQGRMWVMRQNGAVDSPDGTQHLPSILGMELPKVMGWSRSPSGDIWLAANGRVVRLLNGKLSEVVFDHPFWETSVVHLAASSDGGVWIIRDGRIRKWRDNQWTQDRGARPWPATPLSCSLELHDGTLAVGTIYSGLYLVFGDGRPPVHLDRTNGLPQDWIRFLYEDREGNLWAGTGNGGVVSIHPTAFSVLTPPDQWNGCTVQSIAPGHDNSLWISTDGAGIYHYAQETWTHYAEAEGVENMFVQAITETSNGQIWAGSHWWGGPFTMKEGRFVHPPQFDEKIGPVLSLLELADGNTLLAGTRDGLLELKDNNARWLIKSPMGSDDVSGIAEDGQGALWCGFVRGGLARLANGNITFFRRTEGLASDAVQCVFADEDGAVWVGTADNGLSRVKNGRIANLSIDNGLIDNGICSILDDAHGYLWLGTHHGLQRVAKMELNRCADGLIGTISGNIYDQNDGLPTVDFTAGRQGAACRSKDGRLWFASSKGVLYVDPARITTNQAPPPVVAQSLLVDGKQVNIEQDLVQGKLRPDHERLEFRYASLSFVAPAKVRFRYRLDGLDKDWIDAGTRRAAFYSQLPAGSYCFHVIACNNDGVWNQEGASLSFTVAPFFWQTWWFVSASLLAASVVIALLARFITRRRMQRHIERMEREHEIERERSRIAQDIHDDVGASLSRIAMLSQPAKADLEEPERAATMLARIYSTAREVTRSLDEIVWAVDPRHDTLDSLVDYMGKFAQSFLAAANLRCRLKLPVDVPAWPLTAEIRHNLFLSFKEALNNAAKHASASEVRIALSVGPHSFQLEVNDNGQGIPPMPGTPEPDRISSGNGLSNMRTRLTRIGGTCNISSEAGTGTTVVFIVPAGPPLSSTLPAKYKT